MTEPAVLTQDAAVREAPATRGVPAGRGGMARRVAAALAWSAALAALLAGWWWTGTPGGDIARYVAYWALALVLPGTLVHRALRGSRGNLPEDLGYGAAVGLLLELAAWAVATASGTQPALRWWPVPVLALFVAVPGLRRHWRIARPRPLPLPWTLAVAGVLVLLVAWAAVGWRANPLPPVDHVYYQDLLYHLGLVHELTRDMPFELPQLAGEPLRYHYLVDAHLASASMITGTGPATVLLRLWLVPVAATAVVVTAGLARDLSGRWWAGPVAAGTAYVGVSLSLGSAATASGTLPLSVESPSQTYLLPLLLLLIGVCVDVVRGRRPGPGWALVPAAGLAVAGAKSSGLPPLIAGVALAGVVVGWRARRVPWAVVSLFAVLVAAMVVGYRLFAGGGAGVLSPQVFGVLRFTAPWRQTVGAGGGIAAGGLLPPGLAAAGGTGWLFAVAVLGWWLVLQAPRFVGVLLLARRGTRVDPAAWLLAGALVAGAGGAWSFFHPSVSQLYFFLAVVPFGALLTGWLLAAARPWWPVVAVAGAVGAAAQWLLDPLGPPERTRRAWLWAMAVPAGRVLLLAGVAALLAVLLTGLRARRGRGRLPAGPGEDRPPAGASWRSRAAVAGAVAALCGASVAGGLEWTARRVGDPPRVLSAADRPWAITRDEARAALWLDAHAGPEDVVATNVHCRPVPTVAHCDARAFWVSGLGGRRALVESWGYTDEALAAHARDGFSYPRQPAPDPELFARNERLFTAPTAGELDRVRRENGVRWLFADSAAGPVSPELARLAEVRFVAGPVTVYRLR
ncbi:hypothetical protein E1258_03555 [Micromonospora sp. KC207]|uniref:hypothetical protein n=1 Tax=Micromonospora sp. KC207 TaxID=2530377 RepID=UPI00104DF7CE|nr:hypothetical protein [Micromonospora sp. KC207]TDC66172.1 hypothetical protein E1258_03555 [Micromonospora sp. KC207]